MSRVSTPTEGTLAKTFLFHPSILCKQCKSEIPQSESVECGCCFTEVCKDCTSLVPNLSELVCIKCKASINKIEENLIHKIKVEKNNNELLTSQIIQSFKSLQEIKLCMMSNMQEIRRIEIIKAQSNSLKLQFRESFNVILEKEKEKTNITQEIHALQDILCEKNERLANVMGKKSTAEEELTISKNPVNTEPLNAEDLFSEHHFLSEKIKEIEADDYSFVLEIKESIQVLKRQIETEKALPVLPKRKSSDLFPQPDPSSSQSFLQAKELFAVQKQSRLLQEEINITKRHIEVLKNRGQQDSQAKNNLLVLL